VSPKWNSFFRRSDQGQDLAEYCLIAAVIALIGLALFIHISGGLQNLWGTANSTIAAGSSNPAANADTGGHEGQDGHSDHRDR
jgi:Flp pilus assembly pilin Flp